MSIGLINFISVFVLVTLVHEVKLNKNEKCRLGNYAEIKYNYFFIFYFSNVYFSNSEYVFMALTLVVFTCLVNCE